jgi:hypothetical protein
MIGGIAMIKKELYEEIIIHIDKGELARMLDLEPGYTVQNIDEVGEEFRFILSRRTNLSEKPRREERRSFL